MEICSCCGAVIPYNTKITVKKHPNGKMKTWTEVTTDSDGIVISKRVDEYTYYEDNRTKDIVQRVYDGDDLLISSKTVSHTEDGTISVTEGVKEIKNG